MAVLKSTTVLSMARYQSTESRIRKAADSGIFQYYVAACSEEGMHHSLYIYKMSRVWSLYVVHSLITHVIQ